MKSKSFLRIVKRRKEREWKEPEKWPLFRGSRKQGSLKKKKKKKERENEKQMAEEELLLAIVVPCNMHVKHIQKKKKEKA